MSKFVIECPKCGTYHEASIGFFSKRELECKCGYVINVKKDRYTLVDCPHCGNSVLLDQAEGEKALCPVCKEKLLPAGALNNYVTVDCPQCSCKLHIKKNVEHYICPLCNEKIDVKALALKQEITKSGNPVIIKYEGPNNLIVWKHPIEDYNLGSRLIVHDSQVAILFKNGKALDEFTAGEYLIGEDNLPALKNEDSGKLNKVIHSEIYFVNMVTEQGIKWGTDSKVRMFDPASGLSVELGACGEFSLRVVNARDLLVKLVGTTSELRTSDVLDSIFDYKYISGKFKALVVSRVKSVLAKYIKDNQINILEVDEHYDELSESIKNDINKTFEQYGMTMPEFYILKVLTPDDDPNFRKLKEQYAEQYLLVRDEQIKKNVAIAQQQRKVIEAQTGAQEEIIAAQAKAEAYRLMAEAEAKEMQMKGYTYQDETKRKVSVAAMENMPEGSIVGDVVGASVAMGAMGSVIDMTKDAFNTNTENKPQSNSWDCECGEKNITSKFCPNCGNKKPELETWECPNCHEKGLTKAFCPNCGYKKPSPTWDCECGEKEIKSNFCPNCGNKRK